MLQSHPDAMPITRAPAADAILTIRDGVMEGGCGAGDEEGPTDGDGDAVPP